MFVQSIFLDDLNTEYFYLAPPVPCQLSKAVSCVSDVAIAATGATITLSDGTTTIGTITIAASAAEGDCDVMVLDTTSLGDVNLGPSTPLYILGAGAATGKVNLSLVFNEFGG